MRRVQGFVLTLCIGAAFVGCARSQPTEAARPALDQRSTPTGSDSRLDTSPRWGGEGRDVSDTRPSAGAERTKQVGAARPRALEIPYPSELEVEVAVAPVCVAPGNVVEIDVITQPGAPLAYQAVYAGSKSGAEPPLGEGYGGNDKGFASDDGTFSHRWVVRPDAPVGPARVDVIAGWQGDFGYGDARFAVADSRGDCPKKWLQGG